MENITNQDQIEAIEDTDETGPEAVLKKVKKFFLNLFVREQEEAIIEDYTDEERLNALEGYIDSVAGYAQSLAENMDDYLYIEEESPIEELNREISEYKESFENSPVYYTLFKSGIDPETLAFYNLSETSKQRLLN